MEAEWKNYISDDHYTLDVPSSAPFSRKPWFCRELDKESDSGTITIHYKTIKSPVKSAKKRFVFTLEGGPRCPNKS